MQKYFNIFLEFNHQIFNRTIENAIIDYRKGYVCVIDANVLTMAQTDFTYRQVLNAAFINPCDGSSIATLAGWVHNRKFMAFNGPEIFENYIEQDYRQILLGSTQETTDRIKEVLQRKNCNADHLQAISLPFLPVESFDYKTIADSINSLNPDIIWVSLGAPKQEIFMNKILPYLNQGVMFGIGAAFNFYIGDLQVPQFKLGSLRFIWLNRLFNEPKKLIKRLLPFIIIIPKLYFEERKRSKKNSKNQL